MLKRTLRLIPAIAAFAALAAVSYAPAQTKGKAQPPKSLRLYILDCGNIVGVGTANFGFKEGELKTSEMITPCYLIAHPRGTLMWDVGEIPDSAFKGDGQPAKAGPFTVTKPLLPQLAALGYTPADITYLGLSHYHGDHVANANAFASSTWLVQEVERAAMFAPQDGKAKNAPNVSYFGDLKNSKTTIIKNTDHDVFGDGTVVLKFTPGHTVGHQSLFLKLAKTGPLVLSGDLYHYPEEMTLKRVPAIEFSQEQTAKSRESLENFAKQQKAQLWIQHDVQHGRTLKKAPEFYE